MIYIHILACVYSSTRIYIYIYIYIYILRVSLLCYNTISHLFFFPPCSPSFRKHNCIGHCTVDIEFGCEMPTRCDTARKYIENTHKEMISINEDMYLIKLIFICHSIVIFQYMQLAKMNVAQVRCRAK